MIYHCLPASYDFNWNRRSFLHCFSFLLLRAARDCAEWGCSIIPMLSFWVNGTNERFIYLLSKASHFCSGSNDKSDQTHTCLENESPWGREEIFFIYVIRWQGKPPALVSSHHGLAVTDSQYPERIPLHFLVFNHPSQSNPNSFQTVCVTRSNTRLLQDVEIIKASKLTVDKMSFVALMYLPPHMALVNSFISQLLVLLHIRGSQPQSYSSIH